MADSDSLNAGSKRQKSLAFILTPLAVALLAAVSACGDGGKGGGDQMPSGSAPPPPEVAVVTVVPQDVVLSRDLPGRLEASRLAQVRARANGIVLKRVFQEGSDVKAGQVLYRIDSEPYAAALQSAQASLAQAQANLAQATATTTRYRPLVEANAVSKQEYDVAVASEKQARAQVSAAKAAVNNARINLGYATITAPISGRIGRSQVTEGALVGLNDPTPLATIQQVNPLYVNLTQSAQEVIDLRSKLSSGALESAGAGAAKVQIYSEDGEPYGHSGKLLFSDLSVDPSTGQVSLRAEVPNPEGLLLPGMYVRVRLDQAKLKGAVLLPQQAVTRGATDVVMIVGDNGEVSPRPVQISGQQGGQWVVIGGLQPGEKVLVEGQMKLQMGAKVVKPVPWQPKGQASTLAPTSSAPAASASQNAAGPTGGQ